MKPRYNEAFYIGLYNKARYNERFSLPNIKIYEKEPRYDETSLQQTHFASLLALRYYEGPLYSVGERRVAIKELLQSKVTEKIVVFQEKSLKIILV